MFQILQQFPMQIQMMKLFLRIGFLHLLEPASKYFNGSDGISVIEHLVLQEDTDCPKGSSGLQSEEGLEIYLGTKEQAILNLKEAFENRGVRKDFKDYTEESISHSNY
jgi:hypothetical protein